MINLVLLSGYDTDATLRTCQPSVASKGKSYQHYPLTPLVHQRSFGMKALAISHALEDNLSPYADSELDGLFLKYLGNGG